MFLRHTLALLLIAAGAGAVELSGELTDELRLFPSSPRDPQQHGNSLSLSFQPELYHEWSDADASLVFSPFFRVDQHDNERTHADLREFYWQKAAEDWELRLGVRKVFWGVTESQHLVDIINQTDFVESPDGEDKLGQPMVNLAWIADYGTIDFFLLPYFRERTFPGEEGRLRTPFPVDLDGADYESGADQWHLDWAVRWSHYVGAWDFAVSHFSGTSREPRFFPKLGGLQIELTPYYDQINQTGIELQYTKGSWLWKLEAIHRSGQEETFQSFTAGFEYTFYGAFGSNIDVGALAEYLYSNRSDDFFTPFGNDVFLGTRLFFNDVKSTQILAGAIVDTESGAAAWALEASRRLGTNFKLELEARLFTGIPPSDPIAAFRKDDLLRAAVTWYF